MFDVSYPSSAPSPPMRVAKPLAGKPRLNGATAVPSALNVSDAPVAVHAACEQGRITPFSDVVCFAPDVTTKFGSPFPAANPAALLRMAHPSLHQSRFCEQGPIRP